MYNGLTDKRVVKTLKVGVKMYEGAKALLTIITGAGFDAYYIGGKCRCELNNQFNEGHHVEVKDIDIVTNASVDELKRIFPSANEAGRRFQVLLVNFANFVYEVASYRVDVHFNEDGNRLPEVVTRRAETLDEDRARRDFTVNAIAQGLDGEYLDYTFTRGGRQFSAIADVKAQVIRAIGEPRERFNEDPLRILRAFRFMSTMNFTIDRSTLAGMRACVKLLRTIPQERIAGELRKIVVGRNAPEALRLMKNLGIFKLKCSGNSKPIVPAFESMDGEDFDVLDKFMRARDELEVWTLLFMNSPEAVESNLTGILSNDDVKSVKWLVTNINLPNVSEDNVTSRLALLDAVQADQFVSNRDVHFLKTLVLKVMHLHLVINENTVEAKAEAKRMFFNFCARPYFVSQLDVSGFEMMAWSSEPRGPWIAKVKHDLLQHLVAVKAYPSADEIRKTLVPTMITRNGVVVDRDGKLLQTEGEQ